MKKILLCSLGFFLFSCGRFSSDFKHKITVSAQSSLNDSDQILVDGSLKAGFDACLNSNYKDNVLSLTDLIIGKNQELMATIQGHSLKELDSEVDLINAIETCFAAVFAEVNEKKLRKLDTAVSIIEKNIDALSSGVAVDLQALSTHKGFVSLCHDADKARLYIMGPDATKSGAKLRAFYSFGAPRESIYEFLKCAKKKKHSKDESDAKAFVKYTNAVTAIESMRKIIDERIARKSKILNLSQQVKTDLALFNRYKFDKTSEIAPISVVVNLNKRDYSLAKKALVAIASIVIFGLAFVFAFYNMKKEKSI